ncbi:divergent polysaccharide deacetylase [Campylobacter iguaniorum]|uniref:divergent polysaccharide deacetylase family protein n=1 Tax=Campylobacter iguaniorum TaxID=1244531 RepID=UPI0007C96546|nr:divergent polysaccharide deacetylase family protein [Campylobacter iguaniorum]ANE36139.1 divergent polysaccharide deacetylase [Campylobacter iguaniorum]
MAKRKKKALAKKAGALKIYFGIAACLIIIVAMIYAISSSSPQKQAEKDDQKTIQKIEKYLDSQKKQAPKVNLGETNQTKEQTKLIIPKFDLNLTQKDINQTEQNRTEYSVFDTIKSSETKKDTNQTEQNQTTKISKNKAVQPVLQKPHFTSSKPKLAIIIDDIAYEHQAKEILSLGFKITPSLFPPTSAHPDTPKIANKFDFYMIHLPLEAMFFKKNEPNTLNVGDSAQKIDDRIAFIKKKFSGAIYINNHTGSKFTSNYKSTKMLLKSVSNHGMLFVDSLTSNASKVRILSKEMGYKYVYRDVFIDNDQNVKSALNQIETAVKKAKKNGKAIAIGHPYKTTFEALKIAKNGALKDVELVYLKDIYGLYN